MYLSIDAQTIVSDLQTIARVHLKPTVLHILEGHESGVLGVRGRFLSLFFFSVAFQIGIRMQVFHECVVSLITMLLSSEAANRV